MIVDSYCHTVKCTVIEVGVQGEVVLVEFILLIRVSRPVLLRVFVGSQLWRGDLCLIYCFSLCVLVLVQCL